MDDFPVPRLRGFTRSIYAQGNEDPGFRNATRLAKASPATLVNEELGS
ncbi:hypothetical protein P0Y35_14955 [Kiritimatiellaeota bacterium B1221]|nr:hypothetical protein [Kiritimatiellaeota bacterium B1221]